MRLAVIGLGRMGANMVRRLLRGGHECVVYDVQASRVAALSLEGALGTDSLVAMIARLQSPRPIWLMLPAAIVDATISELIPLLDAGDIVIDGGNSNFQDDIRRARKLTDHDLHYVDVGTSGGIWGLERGFCQMIGGKARIVRHLDSIFATLAPGIDPATPAAESGDGSGLKTAALGYLHCGPSGAGHFVKMVHNGIEYGMMAAYAEGLNLLRHANVGKHVARTDSETAPLLHPEHYQYDFDLAEVAEVWRRGSVIASWLLDLIAGALQDDPTLERFGGRVSDSGEGRWTIQAAIEAGVPTPVLSAALYERFQSRGEADFANRLLSALRFAFGGHREKAD